MIAIQREDFDVAAEYKALVADAPKVGAIVTFVGLVRDFNSPQGHNPENNDSEVVSLHLEHYPGMVEAVLDRILIQARARWSVVNLRVIHRVGDLTAGEQIVFVGVNALHRQDAFAACEFVMDFLKTEAPFWKKEVGKNGENWLETKESDINRSRRWS